MKVNPICSIFKSTKNFITGRLRFPKKYHGRQLKMEDGAVFSIFRHMTLGPETKRDENAIFLVRFRFNRFSNRINMLLSGIPMFLIAGSPGFKDKIWMINRENSCWQGLYQWEDVQSVEAYQKSFVLGLMNKRAAEGSISETIIPSMKLEDYLKSRII